jgi:Protein of unknown function (DUF1553)/Protein of unknown function (DUF1549)/Planctomycete cytochrome C
MMAALRYRFGRLLLVSGSLVLTAVLGLRGESPRAAETTPPTQPAIDFDRQIRPILAENCFACHGPDEAKRKAKLHFDTKEGAFVKLRSGNRSIVPGNSAESALVERITEDDPKRIMPPPESNKKLTPEQITLLTQWIDQGAKWSSHWAFVAPQRPPLPKTGNAAWCRNEIDRFILARLGGEGLQPSPEADRTTLIRRVTLDLTGLPPTPEEVDAFLADDSPDAYEKVVDRLLRSPRYGEHMARFWLDAARYGDTHGLHLDNYREIWPYRDWVIKAFNNNLPFDQFLIKQLAGDLLPGATLDDQVATGFIRCNVSTSEGGSIEEEVYVRNVIDRVDTNSTALLGLTLGCCRCHDHKYDPFKQKDYYQLFAFFNNIDGPPLDGNKADHPPVLKVPGPDQVAALDRLQQKAGAIQKKIDEQASQVKYDDSIDATQGEYVQRADYVWIDDESPRGAKLPADGNLNVAWNWVAGPDHPVYSGTKSLMRTAEGLNQFVSEGASPPLKVGPGDTLFAYVWIDPLNPPKEIMLQWNSGDWKHRAYWGENVINFGQDNTTERVRMGPLPASAKWVRLEVEAAKVGIKPGTMLTGWAFTQYGGTVWWDKGGMETWTPQEGQTYDSLTAWLRAQRVLGGAGLPKNLQDAVKTERGKRSEQQKEELRAYFITHGYSKTREVLAPLFGQLAAVQKEREQIDKAVPTTLVWKERADVRPAYILKRGEYDQHGEQVGRDTPGSLPPMPKDAPKNRLGFARWLVMPENPLTARVEVNRLWQHVFGTGIVKTAEDFGTQGERPSHPELLDWLAVQFREDGWDVKATMKRLVLSATYRQSARLTKDRLAKDPGNRLLSRGPRFRLDAEELRDQALFLSGLLVEKVGGPSVKPPQPVGLWEAVAYTGSNTAKFMPDHGVEKVHRRSMYTFWKRTAAPPQMTAFDAPSRESCTVRRERTNTPLQALLLLNETQFVEAARSLAERTMHEGGPTVEAKLTFLFRVATSRPPDATELTELLSAYQANLARYSQNVEAARKLIAVGETKPDASLNPSELAAWTMVANVLLNLDEVITKG